MKPTTAPAAPPHASAHWRLAGGPGSAPRARHLANTAARDWGLTGLPDDTLLLIDELVANAALHAGGPITLHIQLNSATATLYCQVTDTSSAPPRPRTTGPDDEHGRGLLLLAAIAPNHGWHPTLTGKAVWFTQPLGAVTAAQTRAQ